MQSGISSMFGQSLMINVCKDSVDPWKSCSGKAIVDGKLSNITIQRERERGRIVSLFFFLLSLNQAFYIH